MEALITLDGSLPCALTAIVAFTMLTTETSTTMS